MVSTVVFAKKREDCYIVYVQTGPVVRTSPATGKKGIEILAAVTCLFIMLAPSDAGAFVTHDYPATFINGAARVYFLIACIMVLWAMLRNNLQKEKGWRYTFVSLILFILWDIVVFAGQISAQRIDPSHFIGSNEGFDYFKRSIVLHENDYFYYFASFDYVIIDIAMFIFYRGLKEHLAEDNKTYAGAAAVAVLPLLPVFAASFAGSVIFIVFAVLSLVASLNLYRKDRDNILWNYMIWLSSSFVLFSVSRSIGHVLQHVLIASGSRDIWKNIESISGSINIISFFIVGSISVFFIRMYDIYLRILNDKKKIEDINSEMTELNQELEEIVAERTMGLMALTVADKIRNPAAVIGLVCRRVLKNKKQDESLSGELLDVIQECEKLQNVVGDFENLLKTKRSQFTYENLNDIVREVVPVITEEAENKGVLMSIHLSDKPLKMNIQKSLLRVAIFHVLRNAIDATPEGGLIRLSTSIQDDCVILTISDSGPGIHAEDIEIIFDIFYSTKSKGFGMGLPLVKQIVTEHLGEVRVETEVGKGTTFKMIFPSRWTEDRHIHTTPEISDKKA
jgi:signal transduction histidine kinase